MVAKRTVKSNSEYLTNAVDAIRFRANTGFALVPSESQVEPYAVGYSESGATWCECPDHMKRNHACKHMRALDMRLASDRAAQAEQVNMARLNAMRIEALDYNGLAEEFKAAQARARMAYCQDFYIYE